METSPNKGGSVEQIKVEPDFYLLNAEAFDNQRNEDDGDDDDDDDLGEELFDLDDENPVEEKLVEELISDDNDSSNSEKLHECKTCGKKVSTSGHLLRHERIHTGERPFPCELCDKAFIEASSLKVHMRVHTGEKPYQCKICNLRFTQSCNLKSHYRRNHGVDPKTTPGLVEKSIPASSTSAWPQATRAMPKLIPKPSSKPFYCCVCEEPFFDIELLHIHEETHVPEAPFECRYCSTRFMDLEAFRSHVNIHKVHLGGLGTANYGMRMQGPSIKTNIYGSSISRRSDIPSQTMDVATTSNTVLNSNRPFIASNDPEYPYKCVECKKNFQKHELYYHMKEHLKQKNIFTKKSFKCEKCDKVFEKDITLKKHMDCAHPVVSSASNEGSVLIEALKNDARALSPMATKATVQPITTAPSPSLAIKEEPESALGDDEVNSTVSDNPILTQLLNTTNNENTTTTPTEEKGNETQTDGGFIISAVATVDHSFLEQLDQMERSQVQPSEDEEDLQEPEVEPMTEQRRMPQNNPSLVRPTTSGSATVSKPLKSGPYRCLICSKVFNEHFGFRQHVRAMHYSEKRFKCKECNKKFKLGITLAMHLRIHTAVQPFTCIICYKTFTRSAGLNGHLSSHSYNRVKCAECGEFQINVFNYMKHIEKFHPDFLYNVKSYRTKAENLLQRRKQLVVEITRGLAMHRSDIPNVLARLKGELPMDDWVAKVNEFAPKLMPDIDEVSSSEQAHLKKEGLDSGQSSVVSSASDGQETLPALRAELRKRPLRSNTRSSELEELTLPPRKHYRTSLGHQSPNLKRLLEQSGSNSSIDSTGQEEVPLVTVKNEIAD